MKINYLPKGYHNVVLDLVVNKGIEAIDFYQKVFGAKLIGKPYFMHDGKMGHAELKIGDTRIMLAEEFPEMGTHSPKSIGGSPVILTVYVKNSDEVIQRAITAGATVKHHVTDHFWGDRAGTIEDPFGHVWSVSTRKENLTRAQMNKRAEKFLLNPGI